MVAASSVVVDLITLGGHTTPSNHLLQLDLDIVV